MSKKSKCLLIGLLFLLTHTSLMSATSSSFVGQEEKFVFPFGAINHSQASSIAITEGLLVFPLLLAFAMALLREE